MVKHQEMNESSSINEKRLDFMNLCNVWKIEWVWMDSNETLEPVWMNFSMNEPNIFVRIEYENKTQIELSDWINLLSDNRFEYIECIDCRPSLLVEF